MVNGLALVSEARLPIASHDALSSVGANRSAQVDVGSLAKLAVTAIRLVARDDVIARQELRDALADALDDARGLVAQDAREQALWVVPVEGVGVGVTQRHSHVLNPHLALLRRAHLHLHQRQRLLGRKGDSRKAFDLLARCLARGDPRGWGVHGRFRGRTRRVGAPTEVAGQLGGVVVEVVLDVRGDKVIRMVEALPHAERQHDALGGARLLKVLRLQLLGEEIVRSTLVHEQAPGGAIVCFDELHSVVCLPRLLVAAQI
mmetsp:Transcript_100958/g.308727  ORF Transcript_100958/g.308727 Transcript_100958/m.308727 type:complete len:260 (+) Transcript_100958:803-1582(+)